MRSRIIVCGIVVKGDKVLLGKKAKGVPPYPDVWHTPGGGVEDYDRAKLMVGDTDYDNPYLHEELKRELMEETNVCVKNIKCICPRFRDIPRVGINKDKNSEETHYIFLEYICEWEGGEAIAGSDIVEVRWFPKRELKSVTLTRPSKEMYSELGWM